VASRLEQLARRHDAAIVASAETLAAAQRSGSLLPEAASRFRAVGPVQIQGRGEPVEIVVAAEATPR
jgi:class 3 adenylate cyclase